MRTKFSETESYILVDLSGQMNYESIDSLKSVCKQNISGKRVIFNLEQLKFVGSCGIVDFIDLLKTFEATKLHLCSVTTEFQRLFIASELQIASYHETPLQAKNHVESLRHVYADYLSLIHI